MPADALPPFDQWFNHSLKGRIATVRQSNQELVIDLICRHPRGSQQLICTISCVNVAEAQVIPGAVEEFAVAASHPLLLNYSEPAYFLHFSSAPPAVPAALGALYLAHHAIIGEWRPFGHFFNPMMDVAALLESSAGMLARGPLSVMQAYQEALAGHMMTYLRSAAAADQPAPAVQALLFDDEYYVICQDYRVEIAPLIAARAG